jgi:predicted transcriptional regulator
MGEIWKDKIIEILKNNPQGLTINEIKDKANTTRHTASIVLAELKGEKKIVIRQVGMAKLHYWRASV